MSKPLLRGLKEYKKYYKNLDTIVYYNNALKYK